MVRDETVEEEADIDDIDSTLEEIDDQTEAIEEKLAPEIAAEPSASPLASVEGAAENSLTENVSPPPVLGASPDDTSSASVTSAPPITPLTVGEESSASPDTDQPASTNELTSPGQAGAESTVARARHRRHWRPRRLALEFAPGESVSVTRRLYRSGESEYLLNGRACRLRDIQDLFSGTGLSGAHYAIIEQGRIGQILSAKPMDRRTLVEEAAGITKFRVRQRAAEARLDAARNNLHRVSDIISEIDKQVNSLRRQAGKARRYHQLRGELRELLRRVYLADERTLSALLEELRARLSEAGEEERVLAETVEASEGEARRATSEARGREEELAEARASVAESALLRDRRERERVYQREQSASLERRVADIEGEMGRVRERAAFVEAECETLRGADAQLRAASEETARFLAEAEAAYA
ncbi:MAG: hypothetical protein ACRD68_14230, partial [Pyrinomonadaceae bacterium]